MAQTIYTAYDGITVTVANDSANHQLLTLLMAVDPAISPRCRYMTIQSDLDNSVGSVLIGAGPTDSQGNVNAAALSASNYGVKLAKGGSETFEGFHDEYFNVSRFWVRASGGTVQLNVQLIRG